MNFQTLLRITTTTLLVAGLCACSDGGSGGGSSSSSGSQPGLAFALTDAPSDDLSALNIELTRVSLVDAAGAKRQVFPGAGAGRILTNLLHLRGVSKLLARLNLPPGDYAQLELDYVGATGADRAGNSLTVTPASGNAVANFVPALTVTGANQLVEIDFDVDASVSNLSLGVGGSLTLTPTLLLEVKTQGAGYSIEDFHGRVSAVDATGMDVAVPAGVVRVSVSTSTTISGPAGVSTGASGLAGVAVGSEVEVRGSFDIALGLVAAAVIEIEDGLRGISGPEAQGIVLSVNGTNFDLLVLERRDAVFAVGSVQQITTNGSTRYAYDGFPGVAASFANLAPGQEVRVFGVPNVASGVKLRDTRVEGLVTAVNGGVASLTVTAFERVNVSSQPSLPTQIQVTLGNSGVVLNTGTSVELEGHFNRTAPGSFDAVPNHP